jgi:hypothetical protein
MEGMNTNSKDGHVVGINVTKFSHKSIVKIIVSLTATLRIYILGTVRMSLLHMIVMIRMIFLVVPNIKKSVDTGNLYL